MDREKAIKILEDCKIFDSGGMGIKEIDECKKHNEAIDIAIEALQAEPKHGKLEKQVKSLRFEVKFIEAIFTGYCVIRILAIMGVLS